MAHSWSRPGFDRRVPVRRSERAPELPARRVGTSVAPHAWGQGHIHNIERHGGQVRGWRPLEADGLKPLLWRTKQEEFVAGPEWVTDGAQWLRPADDRDRTDLPTLLVWGLGTITTLAEARLVRRT